MTKIGLLCWKNSLLRIRHWIRTCLELIWPLLIFVILVSIRLSIDLETKKECHYQARAMPSSGVIPWFGSMICNMDGGGKCFNDTTPSEIPGQLTSFPTDNDDFAHFIEQIDDLKNGKISKNEIESDLYIDTIRNIGRDFREITVQDCLQGTAASEWECIDLFNSLYQNFKKSICPGYPQTTNEEEPPSLWNIQNLEFGTNSSELNHFADFIKDAVLRRPLRPQYGDDVTSECEAIYDMLQSNEYLYSFWNTFRNLMIGKIVYYPETDLTKQIIREMNSTFEAIEKIQQIDYKTLIGAVNDTLCDGDLVDSEICDGINLLDALLDFAWPLLECFDTNKMIGFENGQENELIEELDNLMCNFAVENVTDENGNPIAPGEACTTRLWTSLYFNYELENGTLVNVTDDLTLDDFNHLTYKLRLPRDLVTSTFGIQYYFWSPGSKAWSSRMRHFIGGFIYLQSMIDSAFIKVKSINNGQEPEGVWMQLFPYPCYTPDTFLDAISGLLPMLLCLSWVFSVSVTVKNIVEEKESRKKELMRIMGCGSGTLWASWWVDTFSMMAISSLLLTILIKFGDIWHFSDFFLIFIYLLCFAFSSCGIIFLLSTFFSSANLSAACGGILFFLLYLPYNICAIFNGNMNLAMKYGSMLVPTVALGYGSWQFADFEKEGVGAQWSNVNGDPNDEDSSIPISIAMVFMFCDGILYFLIALYIDNVFPGQYGVPKPFYFFLQPSFWTGKPKKSSYDDEEAIEKTVPVEFYSDKREVGVQLINLKKVYNQGSCSSKEKVAVNELSLEFFKDEITSFLGHNGAGKTTTMSMLTGMYTPTSGTAKIAGLDVHDQIDQIRRLLGFCPQHNVLWDDLTCSEHIHFFSTLKGQKSSETEIESKMLLEDCGLSLKADQKSKNLSGGMKRKLSIALAFCGKSEIILLDEPTAGVDPFARRGIWDLLLKYKSNRTIILSTHHMDEADVLGNRIAIISQGELKCVGSPIWLRTQFGGGYYLSIESDKDYKVDRFFEQYNDTLEEEKRVVKVEEKGQETVYRIPYANLEERLEDLLGNLENSTKELDIKSYGIHDTSLEEIFIKIAKEEDIVEDDDDEDRTGRPGSGSKVAPDDMFEKPYLDGQGIKGTITGWSLLWNQFCAMFSKRFSTTWGNKKIFVASVIVPPIFILISLCFTLGMPDFNAMPELEMTAAMYDSSKQAQADGQTVFISLDDDELEDLYASMIEKPGLGTYCMDSERIKELRDYYSSPAIGGPQRYCLPENDIGEFSELENHLSYSYSQNYTAQWNENHPEYNYTDYSDCVCSMNDYVNALMDCGSFPNGTKYLTKGNYFQLQKDSYAGFEVAHMTDRNVSDWLTKTIDGTSFNFRRYGGFSLGAKNEFSIQTQILINQFIPDFMENMSRYINPNNVKVWFNNFGQHASVAYHNVMSNALLRRVTKRDENNEINPINASAIGITTFSHPYDYTINNVDDAAFVQLSRDVFIAICIVFAMSFIPASFTIFLIEERSCGGKHLQLLAGLNPTIYWMANYLWDMIIYIFPVLLALVTFFAWDLQCFISGYNIGCTILMFMLFGASVTPLMYPATYYFETPSSAYVALTALNLFIGINTTIAVNIMAVIADNDPDLVYIYDILNVVFLIFPHFCLGRGLVRMAIDQSYYDAYKEIGFEKTRNYSMLDWDHNGPNCLAMAIETVVFCALVLAIEYNFWVKRTSIPSDSGYSEVGDEDVAKEKKRVLESRDILKVENISKVFKQRGSNAKLVAVDDLSFAIPKGQCFGLLGVNGAGKTTTFKMLTTEILPSSGDANINGISIVNKPIEVRKNIGYCPQFDGINKTLTAEEHVRYYAKLRGVRDVEIPVVTDWIINEMNLAKYRQIPAGEYSGGNKRKLSTAIALTGSPDVILLDEPTAGVDPKARRFLWTVVKKMIKNGHCIILTSHSMEECETLCGRVAIMVNGRFQCIGTSQHLKSKYGEGYIMSVKITTPHQADFLSTCQQEFGDFVIKEQRATNILIQILNVDSLKKLFGFMERSKTSHSVTDYSLSQTTLDDVFISFARRQGEGDDGEGAKETTL